jgi:hypothetical protein
MILIVLEPQIQQLVMIFLLKVDGMCQIPRNVAVIEVCQELHHTYAMNFVISQRALREIGNP